MNTLVIGPETSKNSVLTGPGHTAVTEIPLDFNSDARLREKLKTKDFVAAYTLNLGCGQNPAAEAI